jgi:hypothetical protein
VVGDGEAQRLGGAQVDDETERRGLLDGKLGGVLVDLVDELVELLAVGPGSLTLKAVAFLQHL